ncbi:MAG: tRNA pseudouridine(54/55) synthase Pus10 [Candidatus Micrarchaeota archaeon]
MDNAKKLLEQEASKTFSLCDEAISKSSQIEFSTFSVQTAFDRKLLALEDFVWDSIPIKKCMALKNLVNRKAINYISKKTKKMHAPTDANITFRLDFKNNDAKSIPSNIYISGYYIKKSREYCQHDWACSACKGRGCKKCNFKKFNYPSIETAFRSTFAPPFGAADACLHASGREDIDVTTLGTGRPFVLEIVNPKKRNANLNLLGKKLSQNYPVEAKNLQFCPRFWIEAICNSHFDKHYGAIIECEGKLEKNDFMKLEKIIPLTLKQKTPIRVVRRRADIVRYRRVYDMKLVDCNEGKLKIDIWAEAGTYIKELIHGDDGRTVPSISSLLGKKCRCTQLDVIGIDSDFISTLRR